MYAVYSGAKTEPEIYRYKRDIPLPASDCGIGGGARLIKHIPRRMPKSAKVVIFRNIPANNPPEIYMANARDGGL